MSEILLCARRLSQPRVHEYFARKLPLPAEYGNNLDALYDVLCALPETVIKVRGTPLNTQGEQVLSVLRAAARENERLTVLAK